MRKFWWLTPILLLSAPAAGRGEVSMVGTEVETDTYSVSIRRGTSGVAERGELTLELRAKQSYTLRGEKDIRVHLKSPPKYVEWGQSTLHRQDGTLSEDGLTYTIALPYRAERLGSYTVKGKVSFRICRDDGCKRVSERFESAVVVH